MSDQMASLYEVDLEEGINDGAPYATLPTRNRCLAQLKERNAFDLVVLGGGLTGATLAHEAVLRGISVLLLEQGFFGIDAISWDVRLAYFLRIRPWEVFRSRQTLRLLEQSRAPHLVGEMPPDSHKNSKLLARVAPRLFAMKSVDEALLLRETILAARQEGAVVVSAVQPTYLEAESESGCYRVGFTDCDSQEQYEVRVGGIVVDPTHGNLPPSRLGAYALPPIVTAEAGQQVVFEAIPTSATSGVSFASFELTDGSFVAVARRGIQVIEVTVLYGRQAIKVDALDGVVQEACAEAGWCVQSKLSQRAIPGKFQERYSVRQHKGIFTCSHRAPWDAFRSASSIVQLVAAMSPDPRAAVDSGERLLPGGDYACELDSFRATARAHSVPEKTIELAISRWRGRVRYIAQFPNGLRELCPGVLRGEIDLSSVSDQAVTVDDVLFGSLRINTIPGWQDSVAIIRERLMLLREETSPIA